VCDLTHVQQSLRREQEKCEQAERHLAIADTQNIQMTKTIRKLNAKIKSLIEAVSMKHFLLNCLMHAEFLHTGKEAAVNHSVPRGSIQT
jgi:hypothetical protein